MYIYKLINIIQINENKFIPVKAITSTNTTNTNTNTPKSAVPIYTSESEAKQVFFDLLDESKVTSKTPWAEITKIVCNDIRWQSLNTIGQKKQAWSIYILLLLL